MGHIARWIILIITFFCVTFVYGIWKQIEAETIGPNIFSAFLRGAILFGFMYFVWSSTKKLVKKNDASKIFNEDFNHERNKKHIAKTIEKKNETEIAVHKKDLNGFYELALLEYENNTMDKATYSKSIVESDGDATKGKALYIKMRVADLCEDFKKTIVRKVVINEKVGTVHLDKENSKEDLYDDFSTPIKGQRTLSVNTKPSGISIIVNDKHVNGVTPLTARTNNHELTIDYVYKNAIIASKVYDTTKTGLSVFENFSGILHKDYNVEPGLRRCLKCWKEFKDFDDKCPFCGTAKLTVPI